jgi:excisionase family DNA binding protein
MEDKTIDVAESDGMYSITGVAKYLNLSIRTVQRMIKRGELRAYRIGGVMRVPPLALEELLRKSAVEGIVRDDAWRQQDLF